MMRLGRITIHVLGSVLALMLATGSAFAQDDADAKQALYPNTAREEPELDLRDQDKLDTLNSGLRAVNEGNIGKATDILKPFAEGTASDSKYAQALALQGLANLNYQQDKFDEAIRQLQAAIKLGVLPNDTYFQLMYQLAQFQLVNKQYADALATVQKWRAEGKKETADSYGLEGRAYYRLEQYPEAIAAIKQAKSMSDTSKPAWDEVLAASYAESGQTDAAVAIAQQQLEANPGDVTTQRNAVNLLINSQQYAEAIDLMEKAQAKGVMVESNDYVKLGKLHMYLAQNADDPKAHAEKAVAVLEAGLASGALQPSAEVYIQEGDAAYLGGDDQAALAAYAKAAELATDGEAELRRGRILSNLANYNAARAAIKAAIDKGVERMGAAYMLLATVERSLKNKNAAVAAMRKAAGYPDTKAKAEQWLREAGN